jgi:hypothetical protein
MRLALVALLIVAAPANAVTFHLVGAQTDQCTSKVYLPGGFDDPPVLDPAPCVGKEGISLDGRIRVVRSAIDGPLRSRWLSLLSPGEAPPAVPSLPGATYITDDALKVRLGLDWGGADHFAALHFNKWGNIDKWSIGAVRDAGAYDRGTTSFSTYAAGLDYSASGPAGRFYRHRTTVAGPIPVSPVPLPATAWLLLAGLLATGAASRLRLARWPFAGVPTMAEQRLNHGFA